MPLVEQLIPELEALRKSPTFAMSLGAKELFHTNFLAFVLESDEASLAPIQMRLRRLLFGHDKIGAVRVWREAGHLDLLVVPRALLDDPETCQHREIALVEAKLKSLPRRDQLDEYDALLENGLWVTIRDQLVDANDEGGAIATAANNLPEEDPELGAPEVAGPRRFHITVPANVELGAFTLEGQPTVACNMRRLLLVPGAVAIDQRPVCWNRVSWIQVRAALKRPPTYQPKTSADGGERQAATLHRAVLQDYAASLSCLLQILRATRRHVRDFCEGQGTYATFYDSLVDKAFVDLRIHDLVSKSAFSLLGPQLEPVGDGAPKGFRLQVYSHYSRGQMGLGIEWQARRGKMAAAVGVQIQGHSYRHYVSASGRNEDERDMVLGTLCALLGGGPNLDQSSSRSGWFVHPVEVGRLRTKSKGWKRQRRAAEEKRLAADSGITLKRQQMHLANAERLDAEALAATHDFFAFGRDKFVYTACSLSGPNVTLQTLRQDLASSLQAAAQVLSQHAARQAVDDFLG